MGDARSKKSASGITTLQNEQCSDRMKRILLPNLFFEEELQSIPTTGSPKAQRLVAELGPVMGLIGKDDIAVNADTIADSSANNNSNRTIVIVEHNARPEQLPRALQHVEFLTLNELADVVLSESRVPSDPAELWHALPWGWSDAAISTLSQVLGQRTTNELQVLNCHALEIMAPDIDAVRFINSRQFQSKFDAAIEMDGTGRIDTFGTLCHSVSEVKNSIEVASRYSPRGWVIKADLSHASRNRLLGTSAELRSEQLAWLRSRFEHNECVYVEPWIERISECGLQFFITHSESKERRVHFIGAAEMLTDEAGHYRGSVVKSSETNYAPHHKIWQPAIDHCGKIADAAAANGYFGHIGFDCMMFRCPKRNRPWLRLSHDINGRLTMGRIALALKTLLKPNETGVWLHASENSLQQSRKDSDEIPLHDVRFEQTSPGLIGGKPAKTETAFVVSGNSEHLKAACRRILGQTAMMPPLIKTGREERFPPR